MNVLSFPMYVKVAHFCFDSLLLGFYWEGADIQLFCEWDRKRIIVHNIWIKQKSLRVSRNSEKPPAKWQTYSTAWQNLRSHPPRWRPHDVTAYPRPPTAGPSPIKQNTIGLQIPPRQDGPRNFLQVTQLRLEINSVNYRTKWISNVEHLIIENNTNQLNSRYVNSPIHVS